MAKITKVEESTKDYNKSLIFPLLFCYHLWSERKVDSS